MSKPPVSIDYAARDAFLRATARIKKPSPINQLHALIPEFVAWQEELSRDDVPLTGDRIVSRLAWKMRRISPFDDSKEAIVLTAALDRWMEDYRFVDQWIRDAAICTLFVHAAGGDPQRWHMPYNFDEVALPEPPTPPHHEPFEPYDVYQLRFEQYQQALSDYQRDISRAVRERTGKRQRRAPAELAALRFTEKTSLSIAKSHRIYSNEKTVEKTLLRFAERVGGLTFPRHRKEV